MLFPVPAASHAGFTAVVPANPDLSDELRVVPLPPIRTSSRGLGVLQVPCAVIPRPRGPAARGSRASSSSWCASAFGEATQADLV